MQQSILATQLSTCLRFLVLCSIGWSCSTASADLTFDEPAAMSFSDGTYDITVRPMYVTSENPINGPGNHANTAPGVAALGINHDGVAQLQIDTNPAPGSVSLCTGSLLPTGMHILTAAHCVTDNGGNVIVGNSDPNLAIFETAGGNQSFAFNAAGVSVHPSYNGNLLNGFDVAVIKLLSAVPGSIPRYQIVGPSAFAASDGSKFGYGRGGHGSVGDTVGIPSIPGIKRFGENRYESTGLGGLGVGGITNDDTQMTYDFDNGLPGNDAFNFFFGIADLGKGAGNEVSGAPGDSGGPTFVNDGGTMKVGGVSSYVLRLAFTGGGGTSDIDGSLNSSFGEFAVDARVANASINSFINGVAIPEPSPVIYVGLVGLGFAAWKGIRRQRS